MKGGSEDIAWIESEKNHQSWSTYVEAIRFGETDEVIDGVSTAYTFDVKPPAVFDTGNSLIAIPIDIAGDIMGRLI
jgi:hypothetical protein